MRVSDIITQLKSKIMKKLFLALMAVCVMASCGGDGGSGKKSPVAVVDNMIAVATTFKANIQKSYDTGNSEAFVRAFENFVSEMLDIKEKYQDVISNMTDEEKEKWFYAFGKPSDTVYISFKTETKEQAMDKVMGCVFLEENRYA